MLREWSAFTPIPNESEFRLQPSMRELQASQLLAVIMSSCVTVHKLLKLTWCNANYTLSAPRCVAYLSDDGNCSAQVPSFIRAVGIEEYFERTVHEGPPSCCNQSIPEHPTVTLLPPRPSVIYGPNEFFCNQHRIKTLAAQYRFLPALAHARKQHDIHFRDGSLQWLLVLDDDAHVSMPLLLHALAAYDPSIPVHVGDFIPGFPEDNRWERVFACGGAGNLFSAAAVVLTQFERCHAIYRRSCLQSDWMVSGCAALHEVVALPDAACHVCGTCVEPNCDSLIRPMLRALRSGRCLSAQHTHSVSHWFFIAQHPRRELSRQLQHLMIRAPAILHLDEDDRSALDAFISRNRGVNHGDPATPNLKVELGRQLHHLMRTREHDSERPVAETLAKVARLAQFDVDELLSRTYVTQRHLASAYTD